MPNWHQIFWDWKAKSADFYTFRMYGWNKWKTNQGELHGDYVWVRQRCEPPPITFYLLLHLQARVTKWVADNISETLYSASGSSLQWNFICSCDVNTPHICHWRHQDQKRKFAKCCHIHIWIYGYIQRKVLRVYMLLALESARQCCDVPMDSQWRFCVYFNHNIDIGDIQRWSLIKILLYLSIKTSKWPLETLILSFHLFKNWIRSEFNASMWCCPYMNQQQCAL